MRYYKIVEDGYIPYIGIGLGGVEITEAEYNEIMAIIEAVPAAPEGYYYRLKADLTWELMELPPDVKPAEDATPEDYIYALERLGVEV